MALIDLPTPEEIAAAEDVPEAYSGNRYEHDSPFRRARLLNPDVLAAQRDYTSRLFEAGLVDETLFEYVMVAVAQANGCRYCTASHRKKLKEAADLSGAELLALSKGDYAGLDDLEAAVMEAAEQLARDPHGFDEDHVAALRAAGFEDADLLQFLSIVGWCSTANTIVSGLGITPADRVDDLSAYDELETDD